MNLLRGVKYKFEVSDTIECQLSKDSKDYNGPIILKKVDVLDVMISSDPFKVFDERRTVVDILKVVYIVWPSKLGYRDDGSPFYSTNDKDRTFRIHFVVKDDGVVGGVGYSYMNIDDLPGKIREMKIDEEVTRIDA